MIDLELLGKGALPDPPDTRDYSAEQLMGAIPLMPEEYEVLSGLVLKIENQNGSSSCVGQAWSKYVEVLEIIENKRFIDLSARFIYSQIFLPQGGAYIRDGAKVLVDVGDALESEAPSYPATENDMRVAVGNTPSAAIYAAKAYALVQSKDFEAVKQAIYQNNGCVAGFVGTNGGWSQEGGIIRPPADGETRWAHAVYLRGWKLIGGQQHLIVHNSWGESWGDKGRGYVPERYFADGGALVLNPWTLIDKPDNPSNQDTMQLIQKTGDHKVWLIINGKRLWVLDPNVLNKLVAQFGLIVQPGDPSQYPYAGTIFISNTDDPYTA